MEFSKDGKIIRKLDKNELKRVENIQKAKQIVENYCLENGLTFEEKIILVELATHNLMGIETDYSQFYDDIIEKINPTHFDKLVQLFNKDIKATEEFANCMKSRQNENFEQNLPLSIEFDEDLTFEQMINNIKAHVTGIADVELRGFVANYIDKSIEFGMITEQNIEKVASNLNELTQIKLLHENDIELGYGQNFYGYTDLNLNKIIINSNDNHGGFDEIKFGEPFRREMYLYHELTHQVIKDNYWGDASQGNACRMIEEYVVQNYAEDIYYSTHNVARPAKSMIEPIDCHAGVVIVDTNLDYYGEFQPLCETMIDVLYSSGTKEQKIKQFTKDVFNNNYFIAIALNKEEIAQFFPAFDEIFLYNYNSFAKGLTMEQELSFKAKLDKTNRKLHGMQTIQKQNDYSLSK